MERAARKSPCSEHRRRDVYDAATRAYLRSFTLDAPLNAIVFPTAMANSWPRLGSHAPGRRPERRRARLESVSRRKPRRWQPADRSCARPKSWEAAAGTDSGYSANASNVLIACSRPISTALLSEPWPDYSRTQAISSVAHRAGVQHAGAPRSPRHRQWRTLPSARPLLNSGTLFRACIARRRRIAIGDFDGDGLDDCRGRPQLLWRSERTARQQRRGRRAYQTVDHPDRGSGARGRAPAVAEDRRRRPSVLPNRRRYATSRRGCWPSKRATRA